MSFHETPAVAVVVAAGSGSRLGAAVPKALVDLEGVPLVRRAVDALAAGGVTEVVVTIPDGHREAFAAALTGVEIPLQLVVGGDTRQESVRLGLAALAAPDDAVVLVHDAARCLVPAAVVRAAADAIRDGAAAAVPVVPVVDSIRRVDGDTNTIVDRAALRAVQTPQSARLGTLRAAHERVRADGVEVTDDASVCEYAGCAVALVPGHADALKITTPVDLILARAILHERKEPR
ncbi:MAG: 2-C-methyl-D-erythritol 4-phosphate cytidylyltransferase [Arachnia sp.]